MNNDGNMTVRTVSEADFSSWDILCRSSNQGTFLHTRKFLSYHGNRFVDCSLLIEEDGHIVGLFPAAFHPQKGGVVVSHPGLTYGGIVHAGDLIGKKMITAMLLIMEHYAQMGYEQLVYKAVPTFYHKRPSQDDLYALHRLGSVRTRCDISSTIDLKNSYQVSSRRQRSLKKAKKAGVSIAIDNGLLPSLWEVLCENLDKKHGVSPVHTVDEMRLLMEMFPEEIQCVCGTMNDRVIAGVVLFSTTHVDHAQYIASNHEGYEVSALDVIFEHCIKNSKMNGKNWFDFGICTEAEGTILNQGLYQFKTEFGGGGFVHEFYEINLK